MPDSVDIRIMAAQAGVEGGHGPSLGKIELFPVSGLVANNHASRRWAVVTSQSVSV